MDLERVSVVLRPRRPMEAVDLGFALARTWARPVWLAWAFTVVPICAGILIASAGGVGSTLLGILALWWLKPVFERVPVWVLSRALFGASPNLQAVLSELPRLFLRRLPLALFVHRFHFARAMAQPVALLEGQGASRGERESRLIREGGAIAFLVLLVSGFNELMLTLALVLLVQFFTPGELLPDFSALDRGDLDELELGWFAWAIRGSWLAAYSVTGPIHAAAGFALYLNRRVHLEGWDIELVFRTLATRVQRAARTTVAAALALAAAFALGGPLRAQAGDGAPQDPAEVAREVLEHEDFARETSRKVLDITFGDPSVDGGGMEILAPLLWILAWVAVLVIVTALVVLLVRSLGWIEWNRRKPEQAPEPPTHLFGLDLRPETLPDDVAAEALALWRGGDAVGALGLLYRAAISRLIERDGLQLEPSDTESDCLRRARGLASPELAEYFGAITRAWLVCAYSSSRPADGHVEDLCARWNGFFELRRAA